MKGQTIFWYDLETFGLNPHYDRVAQFAGIRTDMDLNIIGDPVMLYCKLSNDYLPNPLACLVTGITPQEVNSKGITEDKFIEEILKEFTRTSTIVAGFNNIKFDDEFIRNLLYRNFYDPFEREYAHKCSRWDIVDFVRATHDLRPDNINWGPKNEKNKTSFKLTSLTEANGIEQIGAHDALVDVYATINVAKLIKEKEPKIFEWAINHRSKSEITQLFKFFKEPVLYTTAEFSSIDGCTRPVLPLTMSISQPNNCFAIDLTKDLTEFFDNVDNNRNILNTYDLIKITVNKIPFISPYSMLNDKSIEKRLKLSKVEIERKVERIKEREIKIRKLISEFDINEYPVDPDKDPDLRIYTDGFTTNRDKNNFQTIRETKPEERLNLNLLFDSEKAKKMLFRQIGRNYPETLSKDLYSKWKNFCSTRLLAPPTKEALTLDSYKRKVNEELNSIDRDNKEKLTLVALRDWGEYLEKFLKES